MSAPRIFKICAKSQGFFHYIREIFHFIRGLKLQVADSVDWQFSLYGVSLPSHRDPELRAREKSRCGHIPAIALTAYTRREDRLNALSIGYKYHVPKPVEPELMVVVASLIDRIEMNKEFKGNLT
jgi:DNA-binding NarL/FixJ family response regulator